ncbi:MAG: hypothetical protein IPJ79_20300 [Bacteroidetes bacterium]|nr:hypothetical protein [Bacteroidota bacterium]
MNAYKKVVTKPCCPTNPNMGSLEYEKRKATAAPSKDCKHCPLRKTCIGKTADYKIEDSIHKSITTTKCTSACKPAMPKA